MKNVLFIILISCFSLTIISCSENKEDYTGNSVSTTAPTVSSTSPADSDTSVAIESSILATVFQGSEVNLSFGDVFKRS